MSVRLLPAVTAGIVTVLLAVVLFVPFVAREYRKRGELRAGAVFLRLATLLYAIGLIAYVLVPLPPVAPGFCATFDFLRPQWQPLASLDGLRRPQNWAELSELLADGSIRQFGYNVALFVPLGMLVRYLFRRSTVVTVLVGFGVSLGIELTQLTGIWWTYPCPYRLFDVDDLIANTAGALAGAVFAPVLRLVPGQHGTDAAVPRPVTASRRLLGMACDVLLLWWLGMATVRLTEAAVAVGDVRVGEWTWIESTALWFIPAVVMLVIMLAGRGSTLGQHAVRLRCITSTGDRPPPGQILLRWTVGLGGFAVLQGLVNASPWSSYGALVAVMWCTVHAFAVPRTQGRRGISGRLARLYVVDARFTGQHSITETTVITES